MAFEYKTFITNQGISSTREELIINDVIGDELYIRMMHAHNTDDVDPVTLEVFLVPNVADVEGIWSVFSRIWKVTLAAGEEATIEFPVPGIILEYNDKMEFISDVIDRGVLTITGGRNYNA